MQTTDASDKNGQPNSERDGLSARVMLAVGNNKTTLKFSQIQAETSGENWDAHREGVNAREEGHPEYDADRSTMLMICGLRAERAAELSEKVREVIFDAPGIEAGLSVENTTKLLVNTCSLNRYLHSCWSFAVTQWDLLVEAALDSKEDVLCPFSQNENGMLEGSS